MKTLNAISVYINDIPVSINGGMFGSVQDCMEYINNRLEFAKSKGYDILENTYGVVEFYHENHQHKIRYELSKINNVKQYL